MPTNWTDSKNVAWVVALGSEAAFKAQAAKLVESTRQETGALHYEWSLSADGTRCHIYERYADSEAVLIHGERNAELIKQLVEFCTRESFTVYGTPNAAAQEWLATRNAVILKPLDGFAR